MINTKKLDVFLMKNCMAMYEISLKNRFKIVCYKTLFLSRNKYCFIRLISFLALILFQARI